MKRKLNMQAKEFMRFFFPNQCITTIITLIRAKSVQLSESKKKINLEERIFLKRRRKKNQSGP